MTGNSQLTLCATNSGTVQARTSSRLDRYDGGRYPQKIVECEARDLDHPDRGTDALQDTMGDYEDSASQSLEAPEWDAQEQSRTVPIDDDYR